METRNPHDLKPHPVSTELYGNNHIDDIKESIAKLGILVPLTITDKDIVISGHRRWRCAIELAMGSVPVKVKTFANELDEKRSILEFNRQREKTFSQKMNEAKLLKEIVAEEARSLQANKARDAKSQFVHDTDNGVVGETADIVGKATNIGGRTKFHQAEKIWDKAQAGDKQAQELVKDIDAEDKTINKAYTELFDKAHVSHNSGVNEWYTPTKYIDAAREVMGSIDLDPASSDIANKIVGATAYFTTQDDGRQKEWAGNIWMNPPYAQPLITEFCNLLVINYKDNHIQQACVLVNNATETNFYQNMITYCDAVCFIKGRVRFLNPEGVDTGAPLQGQTILYFGKNKDKFKQYFEKFGVVLYAT